MLPIDPVKLSRRLGIEVLTAELDDKIASLGVRERNQDPKIAVPAADSRSRQRFSVAYQIGYHLAFVNNSEYEQPYGHIVFREQFLAEPVHNDIAVKDQEMVVHGSEEIPERERELIIYARAFACELLMPIEEIEARSPEQPVFMLALDFGVPPECVLFWQRRLQLCD